MTKIIHSLDWYDNEGNSEQTGFDNPDAAQTEMYRQLAEVLSINDNPDADPSKPEEFESLSGYTREEDFDFDDCSAWTSGIHHMNHNWQLSTIEIKNANPDTEIIINGKSFS